MAVNAGGRLMGAVQDEIRTHVVIEDVLCPRFVRMTVRAISSAVPFVIIVLEMAGDAFHVHFIYIVERVFAMAIVTAQLSVFTIEREIRVLRMVETCVGPRGRVVAGVALFSAAALVGIVFSVTGEAGRRRVLMCLVFVAACAFRLTMLADQREVRRVVVERRIGPVARVVTVRALGAELAFMRFIFAVTVDALTGSITMLGFGFVTAGALCLEMLAQQLEVRDGMVKGLFVEAEDIGVAPYVIGMTGVAGVVANVVRFAVKTCTRLGVARDVLVAVQAKTVLRRSVEALMA